MRRQVTDLTYERRKSMTSKATHPDEQSNASYGEDVAAIAASLEDFKRGERGRPAGEHSAELRRKYGLSDQASD